MNRKSYFRVMVVLLLRVPRVTVYSTTGLTVVVPAVFRVTL